MARRQPSPAIDHAPGGHGGDAYAHPPGGAMLRVSRAVAGNWAMHDGCLRAIPGLVSDTEKLATS